WRRWLHHGTFEELRNVIGELGDLWLAMWGIYFLILISVCGFLLWRRRNWTAVYNVDTDRLQDALNTIFNRLETNWQPTDETHGVAPHVTAASFGTEMVLDVHLSPRLRHAVLRWRAQDELSLRVESELTKMLPELAPAVNPMAGWFLTAATALL